LFYPSLLLLVLDPGWVKIRIRDKLPESATLFTVPGSRIQKQQQKRGVKQVFGIFGLGSGIRNKPIPNPGSRGQKSTGSWILIHNNGSVITMDFELLSGRTTWFFFI
jgi:hypothetical protein